MTTVIVIAGIAYWAALLVGIVLVLVTRRRHPRRSTFAAIGLAILLAVALVQAFVLPLYGARAYTGEGVFVAVRIGVSLLQLLGWALVITALLARERDVAHGGPPPPGAWPAPPAGGPWAGGPPFPPGGGPAQGWPPPGPPPAGYAARPPGGQP